MRIVFKTIFGVFAIGGLLAIAAAFWGQVELSRHAALTPEQRAAEEAAGRAAAEQARKERLKGTDCEHLNAAECYKLRADQRKQEAFIRELERSGELDRMREAADDAGVR